VHFRSHKQHREQKAERVSAGGCAAAANAITIFNDASVEKFCATLDMYAGATPNPATSGRGNS
jgi:hypothetical protein